MSLVSSRNSILLYTLQIVTPMYSPMFSYKSFPPEIRDKLYGIGNTRCRHLILYSGISALKCIFIMFLEKENQIDLNCYTKSLGNLNPVESSLH